MKMGILMINDHYFILLIFKARENESKSGTYVVRRPLDDVGV